MDEWIGGYNGWMSRWVDGYMEEWVGGYNGNMDGWMCR